MTTTLDNGTTVPVSLDRAEPSGEPAPWADRDRGAHGWTVTLRNDLSGVTLTVPFWRGSALSGPPIAAEVLDCLASDATYVEAADAGEAGGGDALDLFAYLTAEHGEAPDPAAVRAMIDQASGLRSLLGHLYDEALWGEVGA